MFPFRSGYIVRADKAFWIYIEQDHFKVTMLCKTSTWTETVYNDNSNYTVDSIHYLAVSYDTVSRLMKFYIDGELKHSKSRNCDPTAQPAVDNMVFGLWPGTGFTDKYLYYMNIIDYALSPEQIQDPLHFCKLNRNLYFL